MFSHLKRKWNDYSLNVNNCMRDCWEQIAINNLHMLRRAAIIVAFVFMCYLCASWIAGSRLIIKVTYGFGLTLYAAFSVYILQNMERFRWRTRVIQLLCLLFIITVMSLEVFLASYGRPDDPAIFFAPVIIVLSVVFIQPFRLTMTLITLGVSLFVALSSQLKSAHHFMLDIAIGVVAWGLSAIMNYVMLDLRLRDFCLQNELMRLSSTDSLTGLLNKTTVETAARNYLEKYGSKESSALFVIDLDQFKQINDDRGHQAGDEALEIVGESLMKLFRTQDIVGRVGGDEFVALMRNTRDRNLIAHRAAMICDTVHRTRLKDSHLALTCSIGVAICPLHGKTYDDLFANADEQLYQMKRSGKNGYMLAELHE